MDFKHIPWRDVLPCLAFALVLLRMFGAAVRSSKDYALRLLLDWSKSTTRQMRLAREFTERLSDAQIASMIERKPIDLGNDIELARIVTAIVLGAAQGQIDPRKVLGLKETDSIVIPVEFVIEVSSHLVSYLNLTEAILLSAKENVADREILYTEFVYVIGSGKGYRLCEKYRKKMTFISGAKEVQAYPAIANFVVFADSKFHEQEFLFRRFLRAFWY